MQQWEPSCSMWTDRHAKLIVAFCNVVNVPQNGMKFTTEIKHILVPFAATIQMAAG